MLSMGGSPPDLELLNVHHVWDSPHRGVWPQRSMVRRLRNCWKVSLTEPMMKWDVLLFGDAG